MLQLPQTLDRTLHRVEIARAFPYHPRHRLVLTGNHYLFSTCNAMEHLTEMGFASNASSSTSPLFSQSLASIAMIARFGDGGTRLTRRLTTRIMGS